jgi:hypothetical protein
MTGDRSPLMGDRRKVMFTHSKGDRILSMAAKVGAIASSCRAVTHQESAVLGLGEQWLG